MPTSNRECEAGGVSIVMLWNGSAPDRPEAGTAAHQNSFDELGLRSKGGSLSVR